jgi:hypothetical protein
MACSSHAGKAPHPRQRTRRQPAAPPPPPRPAAPPTRHETVPAHGPARPHHAAAAAAAAAAAGHAALWPHLRPGPHDGALPGVRRPRARPRPRPGHAKVVRELAAVAVGAAAGAEEAVAGAEALPRAALVRPGPGARRAAAGCEERQGRGASMWCMPRWRNAARQAAEPARCRAPALARTCRRLLLLREDALLQRHPLGRHLAQLVLAVRVLAVGAEAAVALLPPARTGGGAGRAAGCWLPGGRSGTARRAARPLRWVGRAGTRPRRGALTPCRALSCRAP